MKWTKGDYIVAGLLIFAVLIGGIGIFGVFLSTLVP